MLGVDGCDKTTVQGVVYDADGTPHNAFIRPLWTHDGRRVQQLDFTKSYKHLGQPRRADARWVDAVARIQVSWRRYVADMRRFRLRRADFVEASNIVTRGLAGAWGAAGGYMSFDQCEVLEAAWRGVYNGKYSRCASTPRLTLYAPCSTAPVGHGDNHSSDPRREAEERALHVPRHTKLHFFVDQMRAIWTTAERAMRQREDTSLRAAVRADFALALYEWGCRTDPAAWSAGHIQGALQTWLDKEDPVRRVGSVVLLAYIYATGGVGWHWEHQPEQGEPLGAGGGALDGLSDLCSVPASCIAGEGAV